jgi:uncharacterized protein YdeI (YjbR/CyaY-like superfamily)
MSKVKIETAEQYLAEKTADWSRPICETIIKVLRKEGMREEIKWGAPCYSHHGIVCSVASFKHHVAVWFHQGAMLKDTKKVLRQAQENTKALRSIVYKSMDDVDAKTLSAYAKEAMFVNEKGLKYDHKKTRKELVVPDYFMKRIQKNKKALATYESFSYSKKKDYVQWIVEAKKEETRERRMLQAIDMMAEGKGRHDKYKNS